MALELGEVETEAEICVLAKHHHFLFDPGDSNLTICGVVIWQMLLKIGQTEGRS